MLLNRISLAVIVICLVIIPNDSSFVCELFSLPNSFNIKHLSADYLLENNHLNLIVDRPVAIHSGEINQTRMPEHNLSVPVQESRTRKLTDNLVTNKNALQLWKYWKVLFKQSDLQQIPIVNTLLAEKLRKQPQPEIYQNIGALLQDPGLSIELKALLLDLLTEIATPAALAQLIDMVNSSMDSPLYAFLLQALSRIGDNRWNGQFHEELSPMLQAAWSDPPIADESFITAVGTALANVGAPAGIEQLLDSVAGKDSYTGYLKTGQDGEIDRIKQQVAYHMLADEVHNPNAIDVLNDCLNNAEFGSPESEICPEALAQIDTPEAIAAVINDFRRAPAQKKMHVKMTLTKIHDPDSIQLVVSASSLPFKSPEIQNEVIAFVTGLLADDGLTTSLSDH